MSLLRKTVFGRQKANTFIGGVSSVIDTASKLALKIGVIEARILKFKIAGEDISCFISGGNYTIKSSAFENDPNITYYNDKSGLVNSIGDYAFRADTLVIKKLNSVNFFNCINLSPYIFYNQNQLENAELYNLESIGEFAFYKVPLLKIDYPNCGLIGRYAFQDVTTSTSINLPLASTIGEYAFLNNTSTTSVTLDSLIDVSIGLFRGMTALVSCYLPLATIIRDSVFRGCVNLETVFMPNITKIIKTDGGFGVFGNSKLTTIDLPMLTEIDGTYAFYNLSLITLINIPLCTKIGSSHTVDNFTFSNIKIGCVINAHISLQTSNAGGIEADLQYAITSRFAIVNFITP